MKNNEAHLRVHEFAKQHGVSSKDILRVLQESGIELSSHMVVLPEEALKVLHKKFKLDYIEASGKSPSLDKKKEPVKKGAKEVEKKSIKPTSVKVEEKKKFEKIEEPEQKEKKISEKTVTASRPASEKFKEEKILKSSPTIKEEKIPEKIVSKKPEFEKISEKLEAPKILIEKSKEEKIASESSFLKTKEEASQIKKVIPEKVITEKVITEKVEQPSKVEKEFISPEKKQITKEVAKEIKGPEGIVAEPMSVGDFADKIKKNASDVILTLLKQGVAATKNQIVSDKVIAQLARHYGVPLIERKIEAKKAAPEAIKAESGKFEERLPIVVVVGHVDHGKTTLLDFIRKTHVTVKEKGGITQHIGAYEAHTKHGNLVFLDTPGHEAFKKMRERGTRVADIAILVVAADDGIMPQTVEAIKQAQNANIPIIVAINKIDRANSQQIEAVKRGLAQYGLLPEDWGGQTICIPISAKVGTGVEDLMEVVVLQSKLMELTAALDVPACGYVIEASMEKGRGAVATVICQHGILQVGDHFVAGDTSGKVTSLQDSWGKRIQKAYPSLPVQITGFSALPKAGDLFQVQSLEEIKKLKHGAIQKPTTSGALKTMAATDAGYNIIIKADNDSTREALLDSVNKINEKAEKKIRIISTGIGSVSENDVQFAHDTSSIIYTLHSSMEPTASAMSLKYGVIVKQFDIIYKLLDDLILLVESEKPIKMVFRKIGEAIIIKVFNIKNLGIIAGAKVRTGRVTKDSKAIIFRGRDKIGEGKIESLQREKRTVKEVMIGFEFAFMVKDFQDWQIDDRVEFYQEQPA